MTRSRYRRRSRLLSRRDRRRLMIAAVIGALVLAVGGSKAAPLIAGPGEAASGNVALGQQLAAGYGWGAGQQWDCLYALWQRESGWSNTADTRATGLDAPGASVFAYGISQARPATKLPLAGQPTDLGGQSSAAAQISWGLGYIASTYQTPCNAWSQEQSQGWY